ncbi:MAG: YjbQ family protein [Chitinophagaceae bacterium]|nr:MAG: YjbQ family protein [Chitinophagaceae bacterium]
MRNLNYILYVVQKSTVKQGILNIFIKHTSAALAINEGADPSVREDMETIFNFLIPEDNKNYTHTAEGSDDMPAHAKSILAGSSINIPISKGKLNLGTWQSIYLCEFRNHAKSRQLVLTIYA